ncbi:unnamed protein product, partial [Aureobasidium pullulans]
TFGKNIEKNAQEGATVKVIKIESELLLPREEAPAATGAKKQKKKWSKGKVKDKAQHAVILDKATSDRLQKEVQSYRLVTVATLVDRLKINGSLARRSLAELEEQGQIKKVISHSKCLVYTRAVGGTD